MQRCRLSGLFAHCSILSRRVPAPRVMKLLAIMSVCPYHPSSFVVNKKSTLCSVALRYQSRFHFRFHSKFHIHIPACCRKMCDACRYLASIIQWTYFSRPILPEHGAQQELFKPSCPVFVLSCHRQTAAIPACWCKDDSFSGTLSWYGMTFK